MHRSTHATQTTLQFYGIVIHCLTLLGKLLFQLIVYVLQSSITFVMDERGRAFHYDAIHTLKVAIVTINMTDNGLSRMKQW